MNRHPPASRDDHDTFCVNEHWEIVRGATGKPVTHHRTYKLVLWDGRVLRTRISRPVNGTQYSAKVWRHILRNQLEVDDGTFWRCVTGGALPDRGEAHIEPPRKSIPLGLVRELVKLGATQQELEGLDGAGAARMYARLWAERETGDDPLPK
ncbi:cytotoxic translational repressor of toxin-antitoxin stability system [Leucobacter sp. Z1108]|uniref:cytotoxic translational repressor of toxin-antitoxin stability system n=1 Tax=Leucobacter sp. Z1108 TaxID=3439066 RepID=UPI003F502FD1